MADFYEDFDADYEAVDDSCTINGRLEAARNEFEEQLRQQRIAAGIEDACRICGCSGSKPCEGGCIWAESDLCSRCYRARTAMAKVWSAGGE